MRFYYTVAGGVDLVQPKPHLSLGGFKSSSLVPNSQFENLFPEITPTTLTHFNQNRYVGIVLRNEIGQLASNIRIYFTFPTNCYSKFKIAAVDMIADCNGNMQMEHIGDPFSKPLNAEFYEASGVENEVNVGDLIHGETLGLWIERELLLDFIKTDQENVYEPDPALEGRYKAVELEKADVIEITISYDVTIP